jgi:fructose-bisphosphate aldolase class II
MVKHVIVFNTAPSVLEEECRKMAEEAREVLTRIPGVAGVSFGIALSPQARYRYLLIVEFSGEEVIDSYYPHPLHVSFADRRFRPLAVDRITTDYLMVF